MSLNVHCLDAGTAEAITVREVDGRNWEGQFVDGENAPFPN